MPNGMRAWLPTPQLDQAYNGLTVRAEDRKNRFDGYANFDSHPEDRRTPDVATPTETDVLTASWFAKYPRVLQELLEAGQDLT